MGPIDTQLSLQERRRIESWWHAKVPVAKTARVLKRHKATIFREIKRNFLADDIAHRREFDHRAGDLMLFEQKRSQTNDRRGHQGNQRPAQQYAAQMLGLENTRRGFQRKYVGGIGSITLPSTAIEAAVQVSLTASPDRVLIQVRRV